MRYGSIYVLKIEEQSIEAGKIGIKLLTIVTSESSEKFMPKNL